MFLITDFFFAMLMTTLLFAPSVALLFLVSIKIEEKLKKNHQKNNKTSK